MLLSFCSRSPVPGTASSAAKGGTGRIAVPPRDRKAGQTRRLVLLQVPSLLWPSSAVFCVVLFWLFTGRGAGQSSTGEKISPLCASLPLCMCVLVCMSVCLSSCDFFSHLCVNGAPTGATHSLHRSMNFLLWWNALVGGWEFCLNSNGGTCHSCSNHNFSWRRLCYRCGKQREDEDSVGMIHSE